MGQAKSVCCIVHQAVHGTLLLHSVQHDYSKLTHVIVRVWKASQFNGHVLPSPCWRGEECRLSCCHQIVAMRPLARPSQVAFVCFVLFLDNLHDHPVPQSELEFLFLERHPFEHRSRRETRRVMHTIPANMELSRNQKTPVLMKILDHFCDNSEREGFFIFHDH